MAQGQVGRNQRASSLAVATYNLHRCVGRDRRCDPARVAGVLKELNADIFGLQEVDSGIHVRGSGLCQIEYLAEATGLNYVAGPTIESSDGKYGNLLLTKFPVLEVRHIDLRFKYREPRGAIDVILDVHGEPVRVIVTHLGLKAAERRRQVGQLLDTIRGYGDKLLMLGDFNEWAPFSRGFRQLNRHFGQVQRLKTFPSRFPIFSLDQIWVKPCSAKVDLRAHISPGSKMASDHLPLLAEVDFSSVTKVAFEAQNAADLRLAVGGERR